MDRLRLPVWRFQVARGVRSESVRERAERHGAGADSAGGVEVDRDPSDAVQAAHAMPSCAGQSAESGAAGDSHITQRRAPPVGALPSDCADCPDCPDCTDCSDWEALFW